MKKGRSKKRGEKEESKKVERWGKCEEGLEEGVLPEEVALTSSFPLKSGSPGCISTRIHPRLHMPRNMLVFLSVCIFLSVCVFIRFLIFVFQHSMHAKK